MMREWLEENDKTNEAVRFCFPIDPTGATTGTNFNKINKATATMRSDGTMWLEVISKEIISLNFSLI